MVAHRITSAMRAQRVLLLDGRDAVIGTHDDLLHRSELYRTLVAHWAVSPAREGARAAL